MKIEEKINKYLNEANVKFEFIVNPMLSGKKLKEKAKNILKDFDLVGKTFNGRESDDIAKIIVDNYGRDALDNLVHKNKVIRRR